MRLQRRVRTRAYRYRVACKWRAYAGNGRMLDLVLQYRSTSGDIGGYAAFVQNAVARYGAMTQTVQITEEPNVVGNAMLDGNYPDVHGAIVAGVQAARLEARRLGFAHLQIGTNTTPLFGPSAGFYADLVRVGGQALDRRTRLRRPGHVPGVFRAVSEGTMRTATAGYSATIETRCWCPPDLATSRCISPSMAGQRVRTARRNGRRRPLAM